MKIYVEGLGYRDSEVDFDQIVWYFEQLSKKKSKGHVTRILGNLQEHYLEKLRRSKCDRMANFLLERTSERQIDKRKQNRVLREAKYELHMKDVRDRVACREVARRLFGQICLN